jgi:hypothetical protein
MNNPHQIWQRLAKAARQAPSLRPGEMPFGFDTRVIADCRARRVNNEPWAFLFRGALACSALIMLLSVAMNYQSLKERDPGPVSIVDSAIRMTLLP